MSFQPTTNTETTKEEASPAPVKAAAETLNLPPPVNAEAETDQAMRGTTPGKI